MKHITVLTYAVFALIAVVAVSALHTPAHSENLPPPVFPPMVWEQQKNGSLAKAECTVKSVEVAFTQVSIELKLKNGDTQNVVLNECKEPGDYSMSEFRNAVSFGQQVELLREARRKQSRVLLAYRGPWNPCLYSVEITD
jgi:hypothetical protein